MFAVSLLGCAALSAAPPAAPDAAADATPDAPEAAREIATAASAAATPPPFLTDLGGRDAGVDRAGNLWVWDGGEVRIHTPRGEVVTVLPVPAETSAVDADREWGLLALHTGGRELRWVRPREEPPVSAAPPAAPPAAPLEARFEALALTDEVADVAWISAGEAAVSPVGSAHRAEIWDLRRRERVAAFGEETRVAIPEAGTWLLRSVLLEHDAARGRLWTLDSFTGDLQVFDDEGRAVARAQLDNPRRADIEAALARADAESRRAERATPARYVILRLAVDETGAGRVVTACSADRRAAAVTELVPGETARERRIELASPCCSRVFTAWQGWLVLYDSPSVPGPECTAVAALP